jgi:two-component sensor histidine kinase
MRRLICVLFLCSCCRDIMAQIVLPDALQQKIAAAASDTARINAYIIAGEYCYAFFNTEGYNRAGEWFEKARITAFKYGDSATIGLTFNALAQVYDALGEDKLPRALEYYSIHNRLAKRGRDTPVLIRSYMNIASVQSRLGLSTEAKANLSVLTALARDYGRLRSIDRSNIFAAYISSRLDEPALCQKYLSKLLLGKDSIVNGNLPYRKFYFLSRIYLLAHSHRYQEAIALGELTLKEVSNKSDSMEIYQQLAKYANNAGLFEEAYRYRTRELDLYNAIVNVASLGMANNTLLQSELQSRNQRDALLQQQKMIQTRLNKWLIAGLVLMVMAFTGIIALVTKVRLQNRTLMSKVKENELLLQEVHHRVKNNLQIVSSFMLLQQLKQKMSTSELLRQIQSRIQALALIHQRMHQQSNFSAMELQPYLEQLVTETLTIHTDDVHKIQYIIAAEQVALNLDTVTPIALITNELLLNTLKHVALHQTCMIQIAASVDGNRIRFSYSDDGPGLPDSFDWDTVATTGMRLIKRLARQIRASVQIVQEPGKLEFLFEING